MSTYVQCLGRPIHGVFESKLHILCSRNSDLQEGGSLEWEPIHSHPVPSLPSSSDSYFNLHLKLGLLLPEPNMNFYSIL